MTESTTADATTADPLAADPLVAEPPAGEWAPTTWGPVTAPRPATAPSPRPPAPDAPSPTPRRPEQAVPPAPDADPAAPAGPDRPQVTRGAGVHARRPAGGTVPGRRPAGLDERSMVRERGERPTNGWRSALFRVSGGNVNPGPSAAEQNRNEVLARIRRPLRGAHRVAVASIKGGVGKTTVAACLGLVLADNRGDRVVALDANPDAGTLADRLTGECEVTVRDMVENLDTLQSLTEVSRYTSLAGRLQVLASEQDPAAAESFDRDSYERVSAVLTRFYNIAVTDSGTGLVHSAMRGTLDLADTLVVVGAPTVDGASRAEKTLDWLTAHGHGDRVDRALVVLSCDRASREVDGERIRSYFASRCRAVVEVPSDPHLATGGRIDLSLLRPATVEAFERLAAHVADGFGRDPLDARDGRGPGSPAAVARAATRPAVPPGSIMSIRPSERRVGVGIGSAL